MRNFGKDGKGQLTRTLNLKSRLKSFKDIILVSDAHLSLEQRAFLKQWTDKQVDKTAETLCRLTAWPSLMAIAMVLALTNQNTQIYQLASHIMISAMLFAWPRLRAKPWMNTQTYFYLLMTINSLLYTMAMHTIFSHPVTARQIAIWPCIMAVTGCFCVLMCPYYNAMVLVTAIVQFALGTWAFQTIEGIRLADWIAVYSQILMFSAGASYGRIYRAHHEALGELNSRTLALELETLRVEAYNRDLALARQMQDSFTPSTGTLTVGDLHARFYIRKSGVLGGDWVACRQLQDRLVIAVADATGKGIASALIVHAIQSLWASAAAESDFDPERWLKGANRTLYELAHDQRHTMSMGIALITSREVSYYSAGHLPLFLVCSGAHDAKLKMMAARGHLLGMRPDIDVQPVHVDLAASQVQTLLLGSDGVFSRGTRTSKKDVEQILEAVARQGSLGLDSCETDDDKLLVRIDRRPVLAGEVGSPSGTEEVA